MSGGKWAIVRKIALTRTQTIVVVVEETDRTAEGEGGTWLKKDSMRIEVVLVSICVGERKAEKGLGST